MSKYSGLPDIDSAPDVFETPDEPDQSIHQDEHADERRQPSAAALEDIDSTGLISRRTAGQFFEGRDLSLESAPLKESQISRLRRLQAEVAQLEQEIGTSGGASAGVSVTPARRSVLPPRASVDLVTELAGLRERLNVTSAYPTESGLSGSQDLSERLRGLDASSGPELVKVEGEPLASSTVGDIDRRLAAVEKLVGVPGPDEEGHPVSLSDAVNRLDHLLNVLTTPRHLDSISRRVKLLLVDLDRAAAPSRRSGNQGANERNTPGTTLSPADQESLNSLFALLPRLDPLIPVIPPLLTRLRSLSGLHAEALDIAADLREIQSIDYTVSEEAKDLSAIISNVQQGLSEAATDITQNWESLRVRIEALEQRL